MVRFINLVYAIRPSRSLLISHVQGMKTSRKLPFCSPPQCASWFVGSHTDLVDYVPQLQHVCGLEKWMIQLADQICCVGYKLVIKLQSCLVQPGPNQFPGDHPSEVTVLIKALSLP